MDGTRMISVLEEHGRTRVMERENAKCSKKMFEA